VASVVFSKTMVKCDDPRYVHWIAKVFKQCIAGARQQVGFGLGLASTLIWVWAQLPQIYMNWRLSSAEGLSFKFLMLLLAGDICNFTGAMLNLGLVTQLITAIWFMVVDGFCLSQYIYYTWIRPRCVKGGKEYDTIPESEGHRPSPFKAGLVPLLATAGAALSAAKPTLGSSPYDKDNILGTLLGWFSACSYISSRCPQIIKNFRRRKTDGLSVQFFWSAVLGNTTYAASILLIDPSWPAIWAQFPWLVGSAGILFFDATVLLQFLFFGSVKEGENDSQQADVVAGSICG
jgi:uncharacterized protein with PQ loop repeat